MKYSLVLLLSLLAININAQTYFFPTFDSRILSDTIDNGNIKVFYTLNKDNGRDVPDDIQVLQIGDRYSKYFSYNVLRRDSMIMDFIEKNPTSDVPNYASIFPGYHKFFWSEYYKDFENNTLTEYATMPQRVPHYWYSEDMPVQNWEISSDTLSILGYLCQKASCKFRGREYTAWFATDIPINNGPWKFGGLPGLIMKAYDADNLYVFEFMGLENSNFPITKYDYSKYNKVKRNHIQKAWKGIFEDYFKFTGATITYTSNKPPKPKEPYHPLELE